VEVLAQKEASDGPRSSVAGFLRFVDRLRRHYFTVAFTITILIVGFSLMYCYFNFPSSQLSAQTQFFDVGLSRAVSLNWPVTLELIIPPNSFPLTQQAEPEVDITLLIHPIPQTQSQEQPAYVMLVLPFHIDCVINSGVSKGTLDEWNKVNDDSGFGSLIYAQVSKDSVNFNSTTAYAQLLVARTFESSLRGVYTILLPLEPGAPSQLAEAWQANLGVGFVPIDSMEVYVTVPSSTTIMQIFPQLGIIAYPNVIEWPLSQLQALTLTYEDSTQVAEFNIALIVGSVCLGTVPSVFLDLCEKKDETRMRKTNTHKNSGG
jgi:hypothetical protein